MSPFIWSDGHIGWPLFELVVFTILVVLVTDFVWRLVRIPFRRVLLCAGVAWIVGLAGLVASLSL